LEEMKMLESARKKEAKPNTHAELQELSRTVRQEKAA